MIESRVPVDLFNPGQTFACLGMLETATILMGNATGTFDWSNPTKTFFRISTTADHSPLERILRFLRESSVIPLATFASKNLDNWKEKHWGRTPEIVQSFLPYPSPDPDSPATLPALLRDKDGNEVILNYWADATKRDNVKFWAGAGGKPGASILSDALRIIQRSELEVKANPFSFGDEWSNSFRFDWRRDYIPEQIGFSINRHKHISTYGYPFVEILAAIGVTYARPKRKKKLLYNYGVLGSKDSRMIDPIFHRLALGSNKSPIAGWPFRRFVIHLGWPSKEGQARCITNVHEDE